MHEQRTQKLRSKVVPKGCTLWYMFRYIGSYSIYKYIDIRGKSACAARTKKWRSKDVPKGCTLWYMFRYIGSYSIHKYKYIKRKECARSARAKNLDVVWDSETSNAVVMHWAHDTQQF